MAGIIHYSVLFGNQRVFRAVQAVKIAPRHKLSDRNINYKDTALVLRREVHSTH